MVEWNEAEANGYKVVVKDPSWMTVLENEVPGNVTSMECFSLAAFTNYSIYVFSRNEAGLEAVGIMRSAVTKPQPVQEILFDQVTDTSLHLHWPASEGAVDYLVSISSKEGLSIFHLVTGLNFTFDGLTPNTEYTIRIVIDEDVYYQEVKRYTVSSPLSYCTVASATSSSIVYSMGISEGTSAILIRFFNSDGRLMGSRVLSFTLDQRRDATGSATLNNLAPNTEYTLEFLTISSGGVGNDGPVLHYATFAVAATRFLGEGWENGLNFTWKSADENTYYKIYHYDLDYTLIDITDPIYGESHRYADNLVLGENYYFQLRACKDQDPPCSSEGPTLMLNTESKICYNFREHNTTWEATSSGNTKLGVCDVGYWGATSRRCNADGKWDDVDRGCVEKPVPIASEITINSRKHDHIEFSWSHPAPFVNTYKILMKPYGEGSFVEIASNVKSTNYKATDLKDFRLYYFVIYAGNEGGFEDSGRWFWEETLLEPPKGIIVSNITNTTATISWELLETPDNYWLNLNPGNRTFVVPAPTNKKTLEDLTPGTIYTVVIKSVANESPEEEGSKTKFQTLSSTSNVTKDFPLGAIIGIALGLSLLIVLLLLLIFLLHRKSQKKYKISDEYPLNTMSSTNILITPSNTLYADVNNVTLMNTIMEVATPGFLKLDHVTQIRINAVPLGAGGAGAVFRGEFLDKNLTAKYGTKDIAVKEVHSWSTLDEQQNLERFLQEVSIMWSLNSHPNIVKLFGYTDTPKMTIITKRYDIDLRQYLLDINNPLPTHSILKIAIGICDGMWSLNTIGICHRDLKTANILLEFYTAPNNDRIIEPIICDFGLARVFTDVRLENQKFVSTAGLSVQYAAPEVFNQVVTNTVAPDLISDIKSDVFSYSIILWELLTRQRPWDNWSPQDVSTAVRRGTRLPIPQELQNPALVFLSEVMQLCWSANPTLRPTFEQLRMRFKETYNF